MALEITYRSLDSIFPDPNNSRTHPEEQIDQIAESMRAFGVRQPIGITPDGMIIAGEGRWLGARRAGLTEYPCIVHTDLSERQRRAYLIADNRIAQNSGWDMEKVSREISDLVDSDFDVTVLAFSPDEVEQILANTDAEIARAVNPGKAANVKRPVTPANTEPKGVSKIVHTCPNCGQTFN